MLNMTKVKLGLISNANITFLFEKSMRNKVSYISKRCTKASNKCLKSHDSKQQSKHIIYLKERNIFSGYVMLKFLPRNGIKRVDPKDFGLKKYISNKSKDCVLEVDIWIEIPKELPKLVPEKIELKKDMLPKYQLIMLPDFYNIL